MAKGKYYFQHDYNALNDPKIVAMRYQYGMEGYGLYWAIIEMLHAADNHKLPVKDYQFIAIAKQTEAFAKQNEANFESVKNYVNACVNTYELFSSDGIYFWCERVLRNMKKMEEISATRRESGRLGGLSKSGVANAKQNEANGSKIKDTNVSKEKEKRDINISKKARDVSFDARIIDLPFSSEKFLDAWKNWCSHKEEIKNKITPTAAKQQLSKLESAGEINAIKMIEKSIASQWKGLFPLDDSELSKQTFRHDPSNPSEIPAGYQKPKLVL